MSQSIAEPIETVSVGASAPAKLAPGDLGSTQKFKTNASRISMKQNIPIFKFDVDISIIYENKKGDEVRKALTKGPKNDCLAQSRSKIAETALRAAFEKEVPNYKKIDLYYDSSASVYTTIEIKDFIANLSPNSIDLKDSDCRSVEVKITKVGDAHQVSTNDVKLTVNPVFGKADVTLLEALNTIISGSLSNKNGLITYKGVHYVLQPDRLGFPERDLPNLPGGQYTRVGLSESVKTLEGTTKGSPTLHCILDMKKTSFHSELQTLIEKIELLLKSKNEHLNKKMLASDPSARFLKEKLKGLFVRLNYGPNKGLGENAKGFIISGFGPSPADAIVTIKNRKMTVQQYFKERFGIELRFPHMFTVHEKNKPDALFPPELLLVGKNQRATTEQLTVTGQSDLVKCSAVLPAQRGQETMKLAKFVGIDGENKELLKMGIEVEKENVVVDGRIMPTPIVFSGDAITKINNNNKWKTMRFKIGAKLPKWTVYSIDSGIDIKLFLESIRRRVVASGMTWSDPKIVSIGSQNVNVENILETEQKDLTKFVFFVARDSLDLHAEIKRCEQKFDLLTQDVRAKTASTIVQKGQVQTVENIVNKMNIKLGGVNWEINGYASPKNGLNTSFFNNKSRLLVIGFESSRSVGDNLVAVGYSGNCSENAQTFLGNYIYAKNHKDIYGQVLKTVIHEFVHKYRVARKGPPGQLYFYFNGISEGQFGMVANNYVERIRSACSDLNPNYKPSFTLVAVSKAPIEKLTNFKVTGTKTAEQNIPPGTCVDTGIVSPVVNEFFLNAHSAFQGSAKTPKFSILFDSSNATMNVHESIAHQLCFMHEIVTSTTSLPVSLMVAETQAKRGAANYQQFRMANASSLDVDLHTLNKELTYKDKHLSNYRFNA